jgi:hypothetical protein
VAAFVRMNVLLVSRHVHSPWLSQKEARSSARGLLVERTTRRGEEQERRLPTRTQRYASGIRPTTSLPLLGGFDAVLSAQPLFSVQPALLCSWASAPTWLESRQLARSVGHFPEVGATAVICDEALDAPSDECWGQRARERPAGGAWHFTDCGRQAAQLTLTAVAAS